MYLGSGAIFEMIWAWLSQLMVLQQQLPEERHWLGHTTSYKFQRENWHQLHRYSYKEKCINQSEDSGMHFGSDVISELIWACLNQLMVQLQQKRH